MSTTTRSVTTTPQKKRGRKQAPESYAEWMARIDEEVEAQVQAVTKKPPLYRWLSPGQKGIVEMLIEHLRSLPELSADEDCFKKSEYGKVNEILCLLFRAKYPQWRRDHKGSWMIYDLPGGEGGKYARLLKGCGGRVPPETPKPAERDDD